MYDMMVPRGFDKQLSLPRSMSAVFSMLAVPPSGEKDSETHAADIPPDVRTSDRHPSATSLLTMMATKGVAKNIRKLTATAAPNYLKYRTKDSTVTHGGYARQKKDARQRAERVKTQGAQTPVTQPYRPVGGPEGLYRQERSAKQIRQELRDQMSEHVKSPREEMLIGKPVPLDDPKGLPIVLEPYSACFAKVELHNVSEITAGRRHRTPRAVMIAILDVKGTPDLYVLEDHAVAEDAHLVPGKDSYTWKTKDSIIVIPGQEHYTPGTYYLRFQSGVDHCSLRCVAFTVRYTPTTDLAIRGPGQGFRPGILDKKNDIGRTFIRAAMTDSDRRKKFGSAGFFPITGNSSLPLPYYLRGRQSETPGLDMQSSSSSSFLDSRSASARPHSAASFRPGSRPGSTDPGESLARTATLRSVASMPRDDGDKKQGTGKKGGSGGNVSYLDHSARPSSALERAVDVCFGKTLEGIKYDQRELEIHTIETSNFFTFLQPRKAEFIAMSKRQLASLFGAGNTELERPPEGSESDEEETAVLAPPPVVEEREGEGALEASIPLSGERSVEAGLDRAGSGDGSVESLAIGRAMSEDRVDKPRVGLLGIAGDEAWAKRATSKLAERTMSQFRDQLLELYKNSPSSGRKTKMEFVSLLLPVASCSGFAVIAGDGPGKRKMVMPGEQQATVLPISKTGKQGQAAAAMMRIAGVLKPGQAMPVAKGSEMPEGADAVVADVHVLYGTGLMGDPADRKSKFVVVSDVPVVGQNVRGELRPYFAGGGGVKSAREHTASRYPLALTRYDKLAAKMLPDLAEFGMPGKQVGTPVLPQQVDVQTNAVLEAMEMSTSLILRGLKVVERRKWAHLASVKIVPIGEELRHEGESEAVCLDKSVRCLYVLMSGEMGLYVYKTDLHAKDMSLHVEVDEDSDSDPLVLVAVTSEQGAVFGEEQVLFDEPWPCTLRAEKVCKVACIPLMAVAEIVLERPDIVYSAKSLETESKFTGTDKHTEMLHVIEGVAVDTTTVPHVTPLSVPASGWLVEQDPHSQQPSETGSVAETFEDDAEKREVLMQLMRLDSGWALEASSRKEGDEWMDQLIELGAITPGEVEEELAKRRERDKAAQDQEKLFSRKVPAIGDSMKKLILEANARRFAVQSVRAFKDKNLAFNQVFHNKEGNLLDLVTAANDTSSTPTNAPASQRGMKPPAREIQGYLAHMKPPPP